MRLSEVETEIWVTLISVEEQGSTAQKLAQYGLFPGDRARVLRVAPLSGPLLIEASGREIALGRQVAEKIFVEPD
jgi:Fe2+ transport system protein FeoA